MNVNLADLHPALADGVLIFDCPHPEHTHRIRIPVQADRAFSSNSAWWMLEGNFPAVTAHNPNPQDPRNSFDCGECFHANLVNGVLIGC